jgi:hypothetical protein
MCELEGFSVVSAIVFEMLSHLPEFEPRGEGLVRVDDPEQFVFEQSVWDRHEEIRKQVQLECESMNAAIATEQTIEPEVVAVPETPIRSNLAPSWFRPRFDRFGGW